MEISDRNENGPVLCNALDVGCDEISCLGGQDGRLQIQIGMLVLPGLFD